MNAFRAAVITVSDKGFAGEREDTSGPLLAQLLADAGAGKVSRVLVPDERELIAAEIKRACDGPDFAALVITTGGTGMGPRDVTPEATRDVIHREAPGIAEAIRAASLAITPRAMLSRALSGIRGRTLILNFPGSPKACAEAFAIVAPVLPHALELLSGSGGECAAG